jgi:hypothetical protein
MPPKRKLSVAEKEGGKIKPGGAKKAKTKSKAKPKTPAKKEFKRDARQSSIISHTELMKNVSYQQIDAHTVRITLPSKIRLSVNAYSKWGIGEGAKSNKPYLRLQESLSTPSPQNKLKTFLAEIDSHASKLAECLEPQLQELWENQIKEFKPINGLQQAMDDAQYNEIAFCFFPHRQYTSIDTLKVKTGKTRETKMGQLLSCSGNSRFHVGASLRTLQLTLIEETGIVEVLPYINCDSIIWIDNDQDTTPPVSADDQVKEEEKKKRKDAIIAEILRELDPKMHAVENKIRKLEKEADDVLLEAAYLPKSAEDEQED